MSMSTVHVALPFLLRLHAEYPPALIEMYKADRAFLVGSSLSTEGFRKQTTRAMPCEHRAQRLGGVVVVGKVRRGGVSLRGLHAVVVVVSAAVVVVCLSH